MTDTEASCTVTVTPECCEFPPEAGPEMDANHRFTVGHSYRAPVLCGHEESGPEMDANHRFVYGHPFTAEVAADA